MDLPSKIGLHFTAFLLGALVMLILLLNISGSSVYNWGWEEAEKSYYKTGELKYEWKADSTFVKKQDNS